MTTTVVIPVQRGREWNPERATNFKHGTPYLVAEHDEGEWAEAVNAAVQAAQTESVIVSAPDVEWERHPEAIEFLPDLLWNCDVTYGPQIHDYMRDQQGNVWMQGEGLFCPHRLTRENFVPATACFRRDSFLAAGGMQTGPWELYNRLNDNGAKFKYVGEAVSKRYEEWTDPSTKPAPKELLATFYQQATPGTAYWRCLLPARFLPGQNLFNFPSMGVDETDTLKFLNHAGDTAIFQFAGDENHHLLTQRMQEQGIRVLIEMDDDYTHWYKRVMTRAGWGETIAKPGRTGYSVEQHVATCRIADGIIVTTEHLAKQYRKLNPNVFVCPNQIDPGDWEDPVKPDDGVFRIGWFGSASHGPDARLIERALTWASAQPDVEIVMIGVGAGTRPWFKFPFRHFPWSNDFGVYRKFLQNLDVGLCPVVAEPWAQNRSDLKALEYGMAGAYPVLSDVPPYSTIEGLPKAKTPKDFLNIVKGLVADRDGTREKAREWREYVLANRTMEQNIDKWKAAICPTNA